MKTINKSDRILNITHGDLDGAGCSIVLRNIFNNIDVRKTTYSKINEVMKTLSYDMYDWIFLTDITPQDRELLKLSDKFIILDHHESSLDVLDIPNMRYVATEFCATKLVKNFCEQYFKTNLSYLDDLVYLINDYDLWIHNNPKSLFLNELYYKYWDTRFIQRFMSGDTRFNDNEVAYIRSRKNMFDEKFRELEIYELTRIKVAFFKATEMVNDFSHKILKEDKYKITLCLNPKSNSISARTSMKNLKLGDLFKELNIGGGHDAAAGINGVDDLIKTQAIIDNLENVLWDRYPELRNS